MHRQGKGFLGFARKSTTVSPSGGTPSSATTEIKSLCYTSKYFLTPNYMNIKNGTNQDLIQSNTDNYSLIPLPNDRFSVRITQSNNEYLTEGRRVNQLNTYDSYGNITQNRLRNYNSALVSDIITNTTYVATTTTFPSMPSTVTIQKTRTGQTAYSTTSNYVYNTIGQVTSKTDFVGLTNALTTTFTYNNLGLPITTTLTNGNIASRIVGKTYDSKGRFVVNTTNVLGQSAPVVTTYDARWGKPIIETNIEGLKTAFEYDGFGRVTKMTPFYLKDSAYTITTTYKWGTFFTTSPAKYYIHTEYPNKATNKTGRPDTKTFYDCMGRVFKTETEAFPSGTIIQETEYDDKGKIYSITAPHKTGETFLTTVNEYDRYNRLTSSTNELGTSTMSYAFGNGIQTTTTTQPDGQVSATKTDPDGLVISTTDNGGTLTYTYNSQNKVLQVKMGVDVLITNEYDEYERQTKIIDQSMGITTYLYDELGQMTKQTQIDPNNAANNKITEITYDLMGRISDKTVNEGTTTYEYYNTLGITINKLKKTVKTSTAPNASNIEEYTYNAYGKMVTYKETVGTAVYNFAYTYNRYGDNISTTYPSGLIIKNDFNRNGHLVKINSAGTTTTTLFTNNNVNGLGQYTSYSLGNGKTSTNTYNYGIITNYSTAGIQNLSMSWNYSSRNMLSRTDGISNKTENFTYDNLDRLTNSSITGLNSIALTFDTKGNVLSKNNIGSYTYSTTVKNALIAVPDGNGIIPHSQQDIIYNSALRPISITQNTYNLTYLYGDDNERIQGTLTQNGTVQNTRYYAGSYEKDVTGSSTKHLHYIDAGEGLVAIVVRENGIDNFYYTYTDHLGSTLRVTNATGAVVLEQNFDAWGRKRDATTWQYAAANATNPLPWLTRGYCGHEHLAVFGLINMNARLYDPIVGRMLSPDNNLAGSSTQGYNRYSYALNNPLKYSDPTGNYVQYIIGAAIGTIAGFQIGTARGATGFELFGYVAAGAGIGALSAGAATFAIAS